MEDLREAYGKVASRLLDLDDFLEADLESSRAVFNSESLSRRVPRPAKLHVVALVGGLPFEEKLIKALGVAQLEVAEFTGEALTYWVRPSNLAVEVCVFKWPEERMSADRFPEIRQAAQDVAKGPITLDVQGVQVHRDGAVVARGFDRHGELRRLRSQILEKLEWMPRRQSSWAHIPLGRILEPVGEEAFRRLHQALPTLWNRSIGQTEIRSLQLVIETQWYMEERSTDTTFYLEATGR